MSENTALIAARHLSKHDKVLSTIIKKYGIRNLTSHRQYFNSLLEAIIGQQLSVKAASSIRNRFMAHFANKPIPELILSSEDSLLRSFGLSNAKVKYVKDLAAKSINKEVSFRNFAKKTDDEIVAELTKIKGVGVWTSHMFLMFTLARQNVLPTGDLGIRNSVMLNYGLKKLPDEKRMIKLASDKNWHPYCSYASLYLWASLDNKPQ